MGRMKLQFSDPESFMYFYEGLRSLQLFRDSNDAADLNDAAEALETGIRLYPDDALSSYYLGIVRTFQAQIGQNTTQNQAQAKAIFNSLKDETTLGELHTCARAAVETLQAPPEDSEQADQRPATANEASAKEPGTKEPFLNRFKSLSIRRVQSQPEEDAYSLQRKIARFNARARRALDRDTGASPTLLLEVEKLRTELTTTTVSELARTDMEADICNTAGLLNLSFQKLAEAEAQFRRALFLKPDWIVAKRNLAETLEAQVPSPPSTSPLSAEQTAKKEEATRLRGEIEDLKKGWQQRSAHRNREASSESMP